MSFVGLTWPAYISRFGSHFAATLPALAEVRNLHGGFGTSRVNRLEVFELLEIVLK
jgi:hypothetical protein